MRLQGAQVEGPSIITRGTGEGSEKAPSFVVAVSVGLLLLYEYFTEPRS